MTGHTEGSSSREVNFDAPSRPHPERKSFSPSPEPSIGAELTNSGSLKILDHPNIILFDQFENRMAGPFLGRLTPFRRIILVKISSHSSRHMVGGLVDLFV